MHEIRDVKALANHRLSVLYEDGAQFIVDMAPLIERGGLFGQMKEPEFFSQVVIGPRGRSLCWPNELDFCADALRLEGEATLDVAS